jgi:hypothetical protein
MQTTLVGERRHSGMQEMGETREPMAYDCWQDAKHLAEKYSKKMKHDFWVLFAAKPHVQHKNAIVAGWDIVAMRPSRAMVGVLVFKWTHKDKELTVDMELSLPYDVPICEDELSKYVDDFTPTLATAAKRSGSILLA